MEMQLQMFTSGKEKNLLVANAINIWAPANSEEVLFTFLLPNLQNCFHSTVEQSIKIFL